MASSVFIYGSIIVLEHVELPLLKPTNLPVRKTLNHKTSSQSHIAATEKMILNKKILVGDLAPSITNMDKCRKIHPKGMATQPTHSVPFANESHILTKFNKHPHIECHAPVFECGTHLLQKKMRRTTTYPYIHESCT